MNIAVIGSGNIATWLINALAKSKYKINIISSRNERTAKVLAKKFGLKFCKNPEEIEAEVIFICVNDDGITAVANKLKNNKALLIHTSGNTGINTLLRVTNAGVLWPLQTISGSNTKDLEVPVFISGTDPKALAIVKKIAKTVGQKVYVVDDEQRKKLHLSAVMTNNFINHLVVESKSYLEKNGLQYEMLIPILKHTFIKLTEKPYNFDQTGPAVRGDKKTISAHQKLLKTSNPELLKMYTIITESIINKYKP